MSATRYPHPSRGRSKPYVQRDDNVFPAPAAELRPGLRHYRSELRIGPRRIPVRLVERVELAAAGWVVVVEMQSQLGVTYDEVLVARRGLRPLRRTATQEGVSLELTYTDEAVRGEVVVRDERRRVAAPLPGRLFSDGAAEGLTVAALPLALDCAGPIWRFDAQLLRAKAGRLRVLRKQLTRTPEGVAEAFVVELTDSDSELLPDPARSLYHVECGAARRVLRVQTSLGGGQQMDQRLVAEE